MITKPRVLYIEDDVHSRRLVSRVLTTHGYEVILAAVGLEGVTRARDSRPQLVLMDINLPKLDGRVATTRLRSLSDLEDIPIVALTANNSSGNRELALAAGCTGFLTKPIDVDLFPSQVDSFLNGHKHTLHSEILTQRLERHAQDVVTQLEAKVRELEKINERLYHLDRLKSDFITLASHELRTPLTLVSGHSQLLAMQLNQLEEADELNGQSLQEPLASVRKLNMGVERLTQVVDEVIGVSRIATNRLDLLFSSVQMGEVLHDIVDELAPIFLERQLTVHLEELPDSVVVTGEKTHIKTAVTNVIENAIKFTPLCATIG